MIYIHLDNTKLGRHEKRKIKDMAFLCFDFEQREN